MHTRTRTRASRRWRLGGASAVIALLVAGCGSDGESAQEGSGQATGTTGSAAGGADTAAFCDAAVAAEATLSAGPPVDFETASPEEIQAALEEYSVQVEPVLIRVEGTAPREVSKPVATQAQLIREALASGDESVFEKPEFAESDRAIDEYMLDNCGFEHLQVTGLDYEFEGIPDRVPAGTVAITLTNEGAELHEIGLARINDDVTQPVEELIALPEDQIMSMISFVGHAFEEPGKTDTVFLQLEPGRYAAACFIPQGSTPGAEGSGPPHTTSGMFAEFTVE